MFAILTEKAKQCPEYKEALLASGNSTLIEDTAHDYWGRGKDGKGLNKLGKLHMRLRAILMGRQKTGRRQPANTLTSSSRPNPRHINRQNVQSSTTGRINQPGMSSGQDNKNSSNSRFDRRPTRPDQQVTCYNCREQGHTAEKCRLSSPFYCHICGNPGHKWKFCTDTMNK